MRTSDKVADEIALSKRHIQHVNRMTVVVVVALAAVVVMEIVLLFYTSNYSFTGSVSTSTVLSDGTHEGRTVVSIAAGSTLDFTWRLAGGPPVIFFASTYNGSVERPCRVVASSGECRMWPTSDHLTIYVQDSYNGQPETNQTLNFWGNFTTHLLNLQGTHFQGSQFLGFVGAQCLAADPSWRGLARGSSVGMIAKQGFSHAVNTCSLAVR